MVSSGSKWGFFHVRNEAKARMAELEAEGNTLMGWVSLKTVFDEGAVGAMKEMVAKRNISLFELIIILFLISFIVKNPIPHFQQLSRFS